MKNIYCGGMYRSGSTILYNIVLDLIDNSCFVDKIHQETPTFINNKNIIIYSYRNVLDCLVSIIQLNTSSNAPHRSGTTFETCNVYGRNSIDFVNLMINLDNTMVENKNKYLDICYEKDIVPEINNAYFKIKKYLNSDINIDVNKYELYTVKKTTSKLIKVDSNSKFWPNHISDGKIDKFKYFLSDSQMQLINRHTDYNKWYKKRYEI